MKIGHLKNQVLTILQEVPETRNSDTTLTIEIWKRFYSQFIKKGANGNLGVWLEDLYKLPDQDDIKRLRAKIQNEEKHYLPTKWEVAKKRHFLEQEWREFIRVDSEYKRI